MAFMIKPYPGQTYARSYADHRDIGMYFGFGELVTRRLNGSPVTENYVTIKEQKVPASFSGTMVLETTDGRKVGVIYYPGSVSVTGRRGKSSKHRVFVGCPDCRKNVPAGRTHQHKCKQSDRDNYMYTAGEYEA
jgi:hypothetical protein